MSDSTHCRGTDPAQRPCYNDGRWLSTYSAPTSKERGSEHLGLQLFPLSSPACRWELRPGRWTASRGAGHCQRRNCIRSGRRALAGHIQVGIHAGDRKWLGRASQSLSLGSSNTEPVGEQLSLPGPMDLQVSMPTRWR